MSLTTTPTGVADTGHAELPAHLEAHVERLCNDGCYRVHGYINALGQGKPVPGCDELSEHERRQVKHELETIMAVYDRPCPIPS